MIEEAKGMIAKAQGEALKSQAERDRVREVGTRSSLLPVGPSFLALSLFLILLIILLLLLAHKWVLR